MAKYLTMFWSTVAFMLGAQQPVVAQQAPKARQSAPHATWQPTPDSAAVSNYLYRTRFRKAMDYPLLAAAGSTAKQLYTCPPKAAVYVLGRSEGSYTKVAVNGRVGYVASAWLADIR
ncbi:hypothetical protein DNI29_17700 [Hymenobacter sediminis]|uniref:SH3 domain-containing protein n=1 Tax=Hymenobacter sediminis TaxID=2218621 RepID=UPI000DA6C722|nr:hypothetical protein [Hymenobacter sediminis]RPD45227.1 hypothetical protein DNI29_17700 [Hymenobacter sediminis]